MKKHFLKIFIIFIFFLYPIVVKAAFGDVRYEIIDVNISNSKITFKGWAFIHKTNNFNTINTDEGQKNGDQKILMRAISSSGQVIKNQDGSSVIKKKTGSSDNNYNFYCELFYKTSQNQCVYSKYNDYSFNSCSKDDLNSYCYYEDIYFEIDFDTAMWSGISETDKIKFQIAVSNDDYERKAKNAGIHTFEYDGDYYTQPIDISIGNAAYDSERFENDYLKIEATSFDNNVDFIASQALLYPVGSASSGCLNNRFCYRGTSGNSGALDCTYGEWSGRSGGGSIRYSLNMNTPNYKNGRSTNPQSCGGDFLGTNCKGTHLYALNVGKNYVYYSSTYCDVAPACVGNDCYVALARGSHIKRSGSTIFNITIKSINKCEAKDPRPDTIACNSSNTLSSVCDKLTISTEKGRSIVKIQQIGTVSNVFTPGRIYNGGGFNFSIMYQNNIKWSYVNGVPGIELHDAINRVMNEKIKDYDSYIAGINITDLKLGDNIISSGMVKQCFTSSSSKNYYGDNGLTVTCIFTFPSSTINYDGKVNYTSSFGINNKYYTSLDMNGNYDLTVTINGMDRITETAAKSDSQKQGVMWTGTWKDSIDGCEINVYRIIPPSGIPKYNFIYRPIDVNNPFPDRNAGINWYDWYSIRNNKDRLNNTYSNNPEYSVIINNTTMTEIKEYNKGHNYLEWDSIDTNGNSSFVDRFVKKGVS